MRIIEIFPSIQGESTLQGLPTVFVRLAGCNLDCTYCDTRYARDGGSEQTTDEIVAEVRSHGLHHACITGGEPLLAPELPLLAQLLNDAGLVVSVETNGSIDASAMPANSRRIFDIKCPGSGEHGRTHPANLASPRPHDEFKFVLTDRADFDYAVEFVAGHPALRHNPLLFSLARSTIDTAELASWILADAPYARLHLQLHTIVWPDEKRGR